MAGVFRGRYVVLICCLMLSLLIGVKMAWDNQAVPQPVTQKSVLDKQYDAALKDGNVLKLSKVLVTLPPDMQGKESTYIVQTEHGDSLVTSVTIQSQKRAGQFVFKNYFGASTKLVLSSEGKLLKVIDIASNQSVTYDLPEGHESFYVELDSPVL